MPRCRPAWAAARFTTAPWRGGTIPRPFACGRISAPIAGANLEDWPVTYDELEPYYEKAEYDLGVSGDESPFGPARRKPLPLPPVADNKEAEVLYPAARRLGWKPFHTPLAILSRDYRGRTACVRCPYCNGFGCEVGAKSSTLVTVIPEALATGNCQLIAERLRARDHRRRARHS